MPTLHWIGKDKVINHHLEVPYKVLEHQYQFGFGKVESSDLGKLGLADSPDKEANEIQQSTYPKKPNADNKIIHGDNLEALKSLLPEYEGKIKCIYIDPPYNTGNESWVYNDNVNDPKIKKWLGQVVGKEAEDLTRHDKWLCMMYPRLKLLHKLLADDGVIFISIDDNELAHLKIIMDEIFGINSFIEYFSWIKTSTPPSLANKSRKTIEYVLCYEKRKTRNKYKAEDGDGGDAPLLNTGNTLIKIIFPKESIRFKIADGEYKRGKYDRVTLNNDIIVENGYSLQDVHLSGEFKWTQNTVLEEIENDTSFVIKSDKFSIRYLRESETFKAPTNFLKEKYYTPLVDKKDASVETNEGAKKELFDIFNKPAFNYPKPVSLIQFFLKFIDDKNSIILDSFAGSGTTAHAVLNLNKQDGGNRKFILIEMEAYAETITAERVKRVINGYGSTEGTGGGFAYYTLGEPLFTGDGLLNENLPLQKIREYIWYTETQTNYKFGVMNDELGNDDDANLLMTNNSSFITNNFFLGTHQNTAYYFYYLPQEITTLDHEFLATIKVKAEQYIIYADNCLLTQIYMAKNSIIFKKIPRDVTKF